MNYEYLGTPRSKKIEVIWLKDLTRESVMRCLPVKEDKTVLMKLEVPLIPGSGV